MRDLNELLTAVLLAERVVVGDLSKSAVGRAIVAEAEAALLREYIPKGPLDDEFEPSMKETGALFDRLEGIRRVIEKGSGGWPPMAASIREARKSKGWTQVQLSIAAGVSLRFISDLEAGANVTVNTLSRVMRALDLDHIEIDEATSMEIDIPRGRE